MKTSIGVTVIATFIITLAALPAFGDSKEAGAVDLEQINKYQQAVSKDPMTGLQINAVTNNSIKNLSLNRQNLLGHNKIFNHSLKSAGITNQKSS